MPGMEASGPRLEGAARAHPLQRGRRGVCAVSQNPLVYRRKQSRRVLRTPVSGSWDQNIKELLPSALTLGLGYGNN